MALTYLYGHEDLIFETLNLLRKERFPNTIDGIINLNMSQSKEKKFETYQLYKTLDELPISQEEFPPRRELIIAIEDINLREKIFLEAKSKNFAIIGNWIGNYPLGREEGVMVGEETVFTNQFINGPTVGKGTRIGALCVIRGASIIGEFCNIKAGVKIGINCKVGNKVTLDENVVVLDNSVIPDGTKVRANQVYTSDRSYFV